MATYLSSVKRALTMAMEARFATLETRSERTSSTRRIHVPPGVVVLVAEVATVGHVLPTCNSSRAEVHLESQRITILAGLHELSLQIWQQLSQQLDPICTELACIH